MIDCRHLISTMKKDLEDTKTCGKKQKITKADLIAAEIAHLKEVSFSLLSNTTPFPRCLLESPVVHWRASRSLSFVFRSCIFLFPTKNKVWVSLSWSNLISNSLQCFLYTKRKYLPHFYKPSWSRTSGDDKRCSYMYSEHTRKPEDEFKMRFGPISTAWLYLQLCRIYHRILNRKPPASVSFFGVFKVAFFKFSIYSPTNFTKFYKKGC